MKPSHWFLPMDAVLFREIRQMLESPQLLVFCFVVPLFWLLVIWGLLGQGVVQKVPVALVDQDNTQESRNLIRALDACRAISFVNFNSPNLALSSMRSGETYGVFLIPEGYAREKLSGKGGTLAVWLDENRYAVAGVLEAQTSAALTALSNEATSLKIMETGATPAEALRILSDIHADFYSLGNMETSFLAFLGSTLIPSLIMLGAMFAFITAFLRELWHKSVNEWMQVANYRLFPALIGKLLPYYAGYILIFLFYLALFTGEAGFTVTGSLWIWFALGALCLACFAASAILIAAIAPTWRMALVICAGYAAPALPFTGFSMPLDSMGQIVAIFGRCLPLTWYIQGQSQQWTLGANLADMGDSFGGLAVIFIVTLCMALPVFRLSFNLRARKEQTA